MRARTFAGSTLLMTLCLTGCGGDAVLGGGKLSWTARDNANWLRLTTTSGTAPTSVTVRASRSAIPIGINGFGPRYLQAAITVSGAGASNTPVTVPVWLTISYVH